MSIESGALGAIIAKVGMAKVLTLGAALLGAGLMAIARPPKSRKEMFWQGASALGGSLLFGSVGVAIASSVLRNFGVEVAADELTVPVHGLIGAMSWGLFGGLAHWRDEKFAKDPVQAVKDAKDVL